MPTAIGYIVPSSEDASSPWVFAWVRPAHTDNMIAIDLPSPMQAGVPVDKGMAILGDSIRSIISPGARLVYGRVTIEIPDSAILQE